MGGHVPEDIPGLDLEEEAVGVGVEELATIPVLPPELVVVGCTSGASRDSECSSPRTPGDCAPGGSYAPG